MDIISEYKKVEDFGFIMEYSMIITVQYSIDCKSLPN